MLGESAQPADIENMRRTLGLDKPLHEQYWTFLKGLATGDLGDSIQTEGPVVRMVLERFPATLQLTLASMLAAVLIAFPLGVMSAVKQGSSIDQSSRFLSLLGISIPNFWLGPMLIIIFSLKLDIFPVSGRRGISYYILPAVTLGTAMAAILTRMIRASLLEIIRSDYIITARSKGVSEKVVVLKHALRNSLIPVITVIGLQFGALLGGSIITEKIFSWPGIGSLLISAISQRDYPVVQGCVLLISFSYVLVNLLTDITYGFLDPRVRILTSKSS